MEHVIDPTLVHHEWNRELEPALRVASGDLVRYELRMAAHDQVREGGGVVEFDFATLYHLSGPVWVEGAAPGDTLRVDVLSLEPGEWGWAAVLPGQGLLGEDFSEPWVGKLRPAHAGQRARRSGRPHPHRAVPGHDGHTPGRAGGRVGLPAATGAPATSTRAT